MDIASRPLAVAIENPRHAIGLLLRFMVDLVIVFSISVRLSAGIPGIIVFVSNTGIGK
jgi:hypothetical protein